MWGHSERFPCLGKETYEGIGHRHQQQNGADAPQQVTAGHSRCKASPGVGATVRALGPAAWLAGTGARRSQRMVWGFRGGEPCALPPPDGHWVEKFMEINEFTSGCWGDSSPRLGASHGNLRFGHTHPGCLQVAGPDGEQEAPLTADTARMPGQEAHEEEAGAHGGTPPRRPEGGARAARGTEPARTPGPSSWRGGSFTALGPAQGTGRSRPCHGGGGGTAPVLAEPADVRP